MAKYFVPEQELNITTSKDGKYKFTNFVFCEPNDKDTEMRGSVFGDQKARFKSMYGKECEFEATYNDRFDRYDVKFLRPEAASAGGNPSAYRKPAASGWSNGKYAGFSGVPVSTAKYCELTASVFAAILDDFKKHCPKGSEAATIDAAAKATAQYWILYQSGVVRDTETAAKDA